MMRGEGGAGVSCKLDQVRVDDMHNPTSHMHEGCMLDEVLCMVGGVDDGWAGVMAEVDGGWMMVDEEVVGEREGWEVVDEWVGMMGRG